MLLSLPRHSPPRLVLPILAERKTPSNLVQQHKHTVISNGTSRRFCFSDSFRLALVRVNRSACGERNLSSISATTSLYQSPPNSPCSLRLCVRKNVGQRSTRMSK